MELNKQLIDKGFRIENGNLVKYTVDGIKRKSWKSTPRGRSQQFMKEKCEKCSINKNLTVHHIIPLNKKIIISEENCQTLCRDCHDKEHNIKRNLNRKRKKKIDKPKKEKLKEEFLLILEVDEWGSYRII